MPACSTMWQDVIACLVCCLWFSAPVPAFGVESMPGKRGTLAQQWLAEERLGLLPWLEKAKVYIYDMSGLGFQSDPDIFRPTGPFCGDACTAQFKEPIWGADLCNHGYGEAVHDNQTADSVGADLATIRAVMPAKLCPAESARAAALQFQTFSASLLHVLTPLQEFSLRLWFSVPTPSGTVQGSCGRTTTMRRRHSSCTPASATAACAHTTRQRQPCSLFPCSRRCSVGTSTLPYKCASPRHTPGVRALSSTHGGSHDRAAIQATCHCCMPSMCSQHTCVM